MSNLPTPLIMIGQFDWYAWLAMFWFMILLEFPRYTLSGLTIFAYSFTRKPGLSASESAYLEALTISVVVAGHNEADAMEKCLRSLSEQTRRIDEIIVIDDGSTDGMREMIDDLRRRGKIHMALSNQVRSGKASSCNMGFSLSSGDIIINLDADCSYDGDAIEKLIEPFVDPRVGATTGSIGVRNFDRGAVTAWQAIEYLISISMGKRVLNMLEMVVCASGAFGAFRRSAVDQIGIMAIGPGEDTEMTLRLRRCGWRIRLAADAWCFTDVPATVAALVRQRRRWDRDTIRIRMRRFRDSLRPGRRFNALEAFEQLEFLVMNATVTIVFPIYVAWLFYIFGIGALYILSFIALIYFLLDSILFLISLKLADRYDRNMIRNIFPYIFTFNIFNGIFLRFVRLYAYYEEWVHRRSYQDSYSPSRVTNQNAI
jgi:cellulose synthase/poly-beta-1,6-N-acetylglucosamine synthase-like glycosyltransferase